ncbi:MAG TPA: TIGR02391 family protein [Gemmatimonadales bacterium]
MSGTRLDPRLVKKLVTKTRKPLQYVREQISKRAAKQGISAEAALILWAKEFGIGTGTFQRGLAPHLQEQVRAALPALFAAPAPSSNKANGKRKGVKGTARPDSGLRAAIDYLLTDDEVKRRCTSLLTAKHSFDRAFREATTVLDDRLKKLAQIRGKLNPEELVAKVLHPSKAILVVSEHDDEQLGFFNVVKGLMAAFRNPTHHTLNDKLTGEDALRFCGFIDAMLTLLGHARVNLSGTP